MDAITTKHLTKRFGPSTGGFTAVKDVTFSVGEGEIYALVGPNGAGKTTLLKLLVGLLSPTSGTASIHTYDVIHTPVAAKRQFGYVSDDPTAYEYLTGREFLTLTGRLRGLPEVKLRARIKELIPVFPIADIIDQPMTQYSRGNKQKIAVLASLLSHPKILIVDEPIVGMDATSIDIMGKLLRDYAKKGNSVLLVTHILDFAETYATRAGIMKEGKIAHEMQITASTSLAKFL
jgi:ABC-2 type transport system ATP-binding protein